MSRECFGILSRVDGVRCGMRGVDDEQRLKLETEGIQPHVPRAQVQRLDKEIFHANLFDIFILFYPMRMAGLISIGSSVSHPLIPCFPRL